MPPDPLKYVVTATIVEIFNVPEYYRKAERYCTSDLRSRAKGIPFPGFGRRSSNFQTRLSDSRACVSLRPSGTISWAAEGVTCFFTWTRRRLVRRPDDESPSRFLGIEILRPAFLPTTGLVAIICAGAENPTIASFYVPLAPRSS